MGDSRFPGRAEVTGVSLPSSLLAATRELAAREDRPVSWVVRRALVSYMDAQGEKQPAGDPGAHRRAE